MVTSTSQHGHQCRHRSLLKPASAAASDLDMTDVSTLLTSVPDDVPVTPLLVGSIAFGAILAVILVVKVVLYSQMELVVAAMLTRHVPGPRVIQLVSKFVRTAAITFSRGHSSQTYIHVLCTHIFTLSEHIKVL